jgi:hypothetical protein
MAPACTLLLRHVHPVLLFLAQPIGCGCNLAIQFFQLLFLLLQAVLEGEMLVLLVLQQELGADLDALLLNDAGLEVLNGGTEAGDVSETCAEEGDVGGVGVGFLEFGVGVGVGVGGGFRGVKEAAKLGEDAFEEFGLYLGGQAGVGDRTE